MALFWKNRFAWQKTNGELGKIDSLAENNLKAVFAVFLLVYQPFICHCHCQNSLAEFEWYKLATKEFPRYAYDGELPQLRLPLYQWRDSGVLSPGPECGVCNTILALCALIRLCLSK